ncbi:hypothetical protein EV127DRAFT_411091 [Xylaria flabelliformis]|nr:hypothetical protein EV127DRAFT_411091 [Xylaria flabelliformis]
MKFLAFSALLAGAAQAQSFGFSNDIPVGAVYKIGTDFVLTWGPQTRTDTFNLTVSSGLANPIVVDPHGGPYGSPIYDFKGKTIVLNGHVKFTDQKYTWKVAPIDGRQGDDWYYSFAAAWENEATGPRSFMIST